MGIYTFEVAENINLPNMTVYRKLKDGVPIAYKVEPKEGYVMYDTAANNTEIDPVAMKENPVNYYYTVLGTPLNVDWSRFTWVAVPRNSVDAAYIF